VVAIDRIPRQTEPRRDERRPARVEQPRDLRQAVPGARHVSDLAVRGAIGVPVARVVGVRGTDTVVAVAVAGVRNDLAPAVEERYVRVELV